jgi:pilus assembly protein CpaB
MQFHRTWSLIAALVLGTVGTIGLVVFVQHARDDAVAGEKLVSVYVAKDKISAGTRADQVASKVQQERVPAKVRAADAVVDLDELNGRVASVDIVAGEQLLLSRFIAAGDQANQVQSSIPVPTGLFQTTVSLDPDQALGGQIRAGNRVAIVATDQSTLANTATTQNTTTAKLVARNILVTTVQVDGKPGEGADKSQQVIDAPTGKFLVTLAVTQQDLESVVSAVNNGQGKIWLAADPGAK